MRILLAIDDEIFGTAIADFATHHQWPAQTEFRLLNVIPPLFEYTPYAAVPDLMQDLMKESHKAGDALIRKIALRMRHVFQSSNVEEFVVEGHPADEILFMAKQWKADLILVGSHGRRGIRRLLLGSVSMAVVSHAPCSVLVTRLAESESAIEKSESDTKSKETVPTV